MEYWEGPLWVGSGRSGPPATFSHRQPAILWRPAEIGQKRTVTSKRRGNREKNHYCNFLEFVPMHLDKSFLQELSDLIGEECWGVTGGEGTGSVISLDIGKRTARAKPVRNVHLTELVRCYESAYKLLLYCPWRIDSTSEVLSGSHMSNANDGPMVRGLEAIRGKKIHSVRCSRPAFDLEIEFEDQISLVVHCSLIGMDDDECYKFKATRGWYYVGFDGGLSLENS